MSKTPEKPEQQNPHTLKQPGKTLAESLGFDIPENAPGGSSPIDQGRRGSGDRNQALQTRTGTEYNGYPEE